MKKQFTLTFTEEDGHLTTGGNNDGFNALELVGLLSLKIGDVLDQVNKSTTFSRVVKKPDGSVVEIENKKEEPTKIGTWYVHRDPRECKTTIVCSACGYTRTSHGQLVDYPVKCPECRSFVSGEVLV